MASSEGRDTDAVFHPVDAIADATKTTLVVGAAGLALSAIQNTLARQNVGPWGAFTKTGGTTAAFRKYLWKLHQRVL